MQRLKDDIGANKVKVGIALAITAAALLLLVAVAIGDQDRSDPATSGPEPRFDSSSHEAYSGTGWVTTHELVLKHEALPCTGVEQPTNFEIFSAGPAVAGLPLTDTVRRCDVAAPDYEAPANRITYVYGHCDEVPTDETGCAPPLEVQTWPACQRSLAEYSFEGEPLPHTDLQGPGAAKVVEINFPLESRIEVYTKSSTIVIFADNPELGKKAVAHLIPQKIGQPPVTNPDDLEAARPERLGPPSDGAMEGELQCQS